MSGHPVSAPGSGMTFADRMLPNQPANNLYFTGPGLEAGFYDLICKTCGIVNPYTQFTVEYPSEFRLEDMASNPVSLRFLQFLLTVTGAQRVLEIGTFVGFSAMSFATALPANGRVVTIEKFDKFAGIASNNFKANKLSDKIQIHVGDAFEVIRTLPPNERFDFAFIDGNKERYADYLELVLPLMGQTGTIVIDDVFFHGDCLNNPPKTEKGRGVQTVLERVEALSNWNKTLVPIGNGIMILYRRGPA